MKKFKISRIPKVILGLAILFSIFLGYIFYLALSALIWSPEARVVNDLLGMLLTIVLLFLIWFTIFKRGCNEKNDPKIKNVDLQTLPLEVENKVVGLALLGLSFFILGIIVLFVTLSSEEVDFIFILLACFLLFLGGFLALQRFMAVGKIILSVDETGITYRPIALLKQRTIGPIPWSEITEIDIKTISSGRSNQRYFRVQVIEPMKYTIKKKRGVLSEKVRQFSLRLTQDENTAILAPLTLLKIKADALILTCRHEQAKHQIDDYQAIKEVDIPSTGEENVQVSCVDEISESPEMHQKRQKIAYILTAMILLVVAMFGTFAYFNMHNKYAGLKNKTQYMITTDEKENPEIMLSFKIVADSRYKYPVVLFATELDENSLINQENVTDLIKLQDGVIKKDKIYDLQYEGLNVASYSKFKVRKGSITLDLDNVGAGVILGDSDYLKLSVLKSNPKDGYIKAKIQYVDGETSENVRIYTVENLKKNYYLD